MVIILQRIFSSFLLVLKFIWPSSILFHSALARLSPRLPLSISWSYQISNINLSHFVILLLCPPGCVRLCARVRMCVPVCLCACVPACRFVRVRNQVATIWCLGILSNLFNIIWCSKYPWEIAIQFNCTPLYVLLNPTSPFFFCSKEN